MIIDGWEQKLKYIVVGVYLNTVPTALFDQESSKVNTPFISIPNNQTSNWIDVQYMCWSTVLSLQHQHFPPLASIILMSCNAIKNLMANTPLQHNADTGHFSCWHKWPRK